MVLAIVLTNFNIFYMMPKMQWKSKQQSLTTLNIAHLRACSISKQNQIKSKYRFPFYLSTCFMGLCLIRLFCDFYLLTLFFSVLLCFWLFVCLSVCLSLFLSLTPPFSLSLSLSLFFSLSLSLPLSLSLSLSLSFFSLDIRLEGVGRRLPTSCAILVKVIRWRQWKIWSIRP